ncbi:MAG: ATP-binding protein [Anaerolineae bacterium]|nr:ATP-binding protein [Anaerolineae bacterium]
MPRRVCIAATLQAVSEFTPGLDDLLNFLSLATRTGLVLAVQELCVNIVEHAYAGTPGTIEIELDLDADHLSITVHDRATQHYTPPERIEAPDPQSPPEGSLGIFIIHQVFDRVEYEPLENGNRWTLFKWLGG